MPFTVTQAISMMQDLHENLLCIGDAAFPGILNQNELN